MGDASSRASPSFTPDHAAIRHTVGHAETCGSVPDSVKVDPARLRQMREQRAWSQEQLAEIAGIRVRRLQRVESSGVASPDTRMALASALGVAPAQLHADVQADSDKDNIADAGIDASAASSTEQPSDGRPEPLPSDRKPSEQHVLHIKVLLAILALLAGIAIGCQLGKNMAERERRADCRASGRTDCPRTRCR